MFLLYSSIESKALNTRVSRNGLSLKQRTKKRGAQKPSVSGMFFAQKNGRNKK